MTEVVNGLRGLAELFREMEAGLGRLTYEQQILDFLPVLEQMHQDFFNRRSAPDGSKWPDWQWRALDAPNNHQTLEVTGRLRKSLTSAGSDHVEQIDLQGSGFSLLTWGTTVPYAASHQFGGTFTLGQALVHRSGQGYKAAGSTIKIPQREFLGMTDDTVQQLVDTVADATVDAIVEKRDGT